MAVWKEREKAEQYNTADMAFCLKFNIGLSIVNKYSSDFGAN